MRDTLPLLLKTDFPPLRRGRLTTVQANLGYRCNQACLHCHVAASPKRTEEMSWETMEVLLEFATKQGIRQFDLTGGAPELNPNFRRLVRAARACDIAVIDRCNLTILSEPGQEDLADFLAENNVDVVASLPCYLEENVNRQRGDGVFAGSIAGLRKLNALGYGVPGSGRILNLVYNPGGPSLPPDQAGLEAGLQGGTGNAPRGRLQPVAGAGQHADPALRQPVAVLRPVRTLHGFAEGRASPGKPGRRDVPLADFRRLAGRGLRLRFQPDARPAARRRPASHASARPGCGRPRKAADFHRRPLLRLHRRARQQLWRRHRSGGTEYGMRLKKLALIAALLALIAAFFALDLGQYLNLATLKARQADIAAFRDASPVLATGAYFVIYVLATALSLPGAALLTLAGGAVFGLLWGLLIVSFASTIGATLAFLSARFLLRDWVVKRFGQRLKTIDEGIRRDGAFYLFTLRLVPAFPFFLINLLMGLTAMKARTFYWVSQVGMLAGTVVYVNAGTQLAQLESLSGIVSPGLLASFVLLGIFPLIAKKIVDLVQARRVYAGWQKPARFDRNLVVIGAGAAGLVTSYIAAAVKAKVTLVEKHKMGGDCLNTGCVPSKALIRSAKLLSQMARSQHYGIASARAEFSFAEAMARVQRVIQDIAPHDSIERYTGLGVEVIEGTAKIVSPWEVDIARADGSMQRLSTRSIVIATGARPFVPPIPGLAEVGCLTSDTVWNLRELAASAWSSSAAGRSVANWRRPSPASAAR